MSKWIQPARVRAAIYNLSEWRKAAKSQPAMHLWPLLAIIEKGANAKRAIVFTEDDDRAFWDNYARLPGDERDRRDASAPGGFTQDFYVEPLLLQKKPSDYYHRSPATIRTRTFQNAWNAAFVVNEAKNELLLAEGYANIFVQKVLTKDGVVHRIPVVDLSVWLFKDQEFPNDANAQTLENRFQARFKFTPADYAKLFVFHQEPEGQLFNPLPLPADVLAAIESALIPSGQIIPAQPPSQFPEPESPDDAAKSLLDDDDRVLMEVKKLLAIGTSGIILRGCPGTSKTWYAKQIARHLAVKASHIFQVQFHPSYGYEDFVEGYRPNDAKISGFEVVDKIFLRACDIAASLNPKTPVMFIIDEINRGDPARIFGELLTYIEHGYRGDKFSKAYTGEPATVPSNLVILGTMNPHDRSVTQLDAALVRRFDHIDMNPDSEILQAFLEDSEGFTGEQVARVVKWFEAMKQLLPFGVGHTYFYNVKNVEHLQTIWQYRILPYCQSVLELEEQKLASVRASFDGLYKSLIGQEGAGV